MSQLLVQVGICAQIAVKTRPVRAIKIRFDDAQRSPGKMTKIKIPIDPGRCEGASRNPNPTEFFVPDPIAEMVRHPAPGFLGDPEKVAVDFPPLAVIVGLPGSGGIVVVGERAPDIAVNIIPDPFSEDIGVLLGKIENGR